MGVLALGRAGEALVAVLVRPCLVHQAPVGTSRDARLVGRLVDVAGTFVGACGDKVLWHGRAIEGPVDHHRSLAVGLPAEVSAAL